MTRHMVFRIVAALVLLAAIAGIAFLAYSAGVAQKLPANVQAPATQPVAPYPYSFGWWHPFWGLGCLIPLAFLFLIFVAFGSMRRMIWGPRWGMHHMHHHGRWSEEDWKDGVPPMVSEWHRKMHGQTDDEASKK